MLMHCKYFISGKENVAEYDNNYIAFVAVIQLQYAFSTPLIFDMFKFVVFQPEDTLINTSILIQLQKLRKAKCMVIWKNTKNDTFFLLKIYWKKNKLEQSLSNSHFMRYMFYLFYSENLLFYLNFL